MEIQNLCFTKGDALDDELKSFAKREYPDSKSDSFAMFIDRGFDFLLDGGFNAMVTMQSWMFLSSYEKLRLELQRRAAIVAMLHMDNMVMRMSMSNAFCII